MNSENMNGMRVLALITDAFGGRGGIAKFNRDLLTVFSRHPGISLVIGIPRLMHDDAGQLPPKLTYLGEAANSKIHFIFVVLSMILRLRKFDILLCGHINLLPIAYMAGLVTGARVLLVLHGVEAWQPNKNWLINNLVKNVAGIVTVSNLTRQRFLSWASLDSTKVDLLPNCVSMENYGPGPKNEALLTRYCLASKIVLLTVARMHSSERYKGIDEIIESLSDLAMEIPNIVYLIVGEGDDRARLEAKAASLGVAERVIFTGSIPEDEKADHFRLADVFVMPSRGEGFGIVYLEAMACGVPVVASRKDGGREALRDGMLGVLVDPDDPADIKRGILEALLWPKCVPEGLDYFNFANYEKRVLGIISRFSKK